MKTVITKKEIEKIDSQQMFKIYDDWPKIARSSFKMNLKPLKLKNIDHIIFAGMGGSGAIGDIFSSILSKTKIHVNVIKGYLLPETVDSNSLVITVSVSGNTAETLAVLESAKKKKSHIIAFSSGGKMEKFCIKNRIHHVKIPIHHSPRASFTAYLYAMLKVLHLPMNISEEEILESILELEKMRQRINSSNLTKSNPAINMAKWITEIPMIYYPFGLQSVAVRFKNSLQENVKIHAISEDVVEACHNGIVSWERKSNVKPILLQGKDDYVKTKERWRILKDFFDEKKIEYYEVNSINGSILIKVINLIYFLDYTTIYRAILSRVDPTPVKSINYFKKRMT